MRILFTSILCAISYSAFAQEGMHFHVAAQPQNTWIINKDDSDAPKKIHAYESSIYYAATIGGSYFFPNDVFGIGMDLTFSKEGQRFSSDINSASEIVQYNQLNYLKIPLYISFNTNPRDFTTFIVKLGFQPGFLLGASYSLEANDKIDQVTRLSLENGDISERYAKINYSGMLAFGPAFMFNEIFGITTMLRLDYGFTDTEDKNWPGYNPARKTSNTATGGVEIGFKLVISPY